MVPRIPSICETLFHLAHDTLGHFGFDKSYGSLRSSFYWPGMRRDLEAAYIPACPDCACNKSSTTPPAGPLHPLPIPENRGDSVAIDFVGPLPMDGEFDYIVTFTDRLGSDIRLVPARSTITAEELAVLFFDEWYCENGLPLDITCDRDPLFTSKFWLAFNKLTNVCLRMSSAYHPQSDGASERTNKTLNQCLRYHVDRNQSGWRRALPRIRFQMMNTVNASTGFSPFQLRMGRSPRLIPPLVCDRANDLEDTRASEVIERLASDTMEAKDNLLRAKTDQAISANLHRADDFPFQVGGKVMLSTLHRRHEYKSKGQHRVAKFMPRYDGPYTIVEVHAACSTVTLDMPNSPNVFPVFHSSQVKPFKPNDPLLFPSRELERPQPVIIDGHEEFIIDCILDERRRGRGFQYLVRWRGYGPEDDRWLPHRELEECAALDTWLAKKTDPLRM